jgi:hypothetical protein
MKQIVITAKRLRAMGACKEDVDLFVETFGERAVLTERNAQKARDADLCLHWFLITIETADANYDIIPEACDYGHAWTCFSNVWLIDVEENNKAAAFVALVRWMIKKGAKM